jgi:pyruvate formate lyase activating enzyme
MKICGLQKLTLLDFPGRVACTVFTGGCGLRCPFCHNASLVTGVESAGEIPEEEVLAYVKKRSGMLDGVCVTGGEPLLRPDLAPFLEKVRALGYLVKLDTNGSFPGRLKALAGAGLLDYVAMDVKNSLPRYAGTIGVAGFDTAPVEESIRFLLSGAVDTSSAPRS